MALPKSVETPRGLELMAKVKAADPAMKDWPSPTKDDYLLIGGIVVLYSYVEFNPRRLVEVFDHAGKLPTKLMKKAGNLEVGEVEKAVRSATIWTDPSGQSALDRLAELRPLRNLVAHFIVRRFPEDDAFLFMTKSTRDYKRVFGKDPEPRAAMMAVIERKEIAKVLKEIQHIHSWLAKIAPEFEKRLLPP